MIINPEVDQAYRNAIEETAFIPGLALAVIDDSEFNQSREQLPEIERRLIELFGQEAFDEGTFHSALFDESCDTATKDLILDYVGHYHRLEFTEPKQEKERDMRSVIDFALSGMVMQHGNLLFQHHVQCVMIHEETGKRDEILNMPINSSDMPDAIGGHPLTEKHGIKFAAEAAYRLGRMLTPEVVDNVLNDPNRRTPTLRSTITYRKDGNEITREVIDG